ncbi:MAG: transglycosylase SLT domain-containing protein [Gammaproteobacteria bacterium]|nr:transglycosylase SLT domain-containing protein [Gammaproteobacteria bacterium]
MLLKSRYFPTLIALLSVLLSSTAVGSDNDYRRLPLSQIQKLAQQGDLKAQLEWATALEHGEGIKRDIDSAIVWYCRAAGRGSSDAQRSLGWIYANGRHGIRKDDVAAAYWLDRAASNGDDYAARLVKRIVVDVVAPKQTGCTHVAKAPWLKQRCSSSGCRKIVALVERLSFDFQLDADLVLAVISAESGFDPRAESNSGAQGLMQLIPATAERFGVRNSWNKEQNLRGGMAYLRWLLAYFEGNVEHALAGYNAGEQRVKQYRGVPPYAETQAYVQRIIADYGKRFHRFDKRWLKRSSPGGGRVAQQLASAGPRLDG